MDIRKVKKLIEMLENSNLEEIEIKEGEESVRLVKSLGSPQSFQVVGSRRVCKWRELEVHGTRRHRLSR